MKNAFYFTSKALFVLKIFKFLSWLFSHVKKQLDYKGKVDLKFNDITAWLANNFNIYTLPNISRSKGNQAMKFGQLKNHAQNVVEKLLPETFLKN